MRASIVLTVLVALAAALAFARVSTASNEPRFYVIVHPDNPLTAVDRGFLRDAYLKKATEWRDGTAILPVDLTTKFPARPRFIVEVIKKTPAQLKNYWNQQIFSGKGVPPPEAGSPEALIGYVLEHRGAVGYLPADVDPGGARVIAVD